MVTARHLGRVQRILCWQKARGGSSVTTGAQQIPRATQPLLPLMPGPWLSPSQNTMTSSRSALHRIVLTPGPLHCSAFSALSSELSCGAIEQLWKLVSHDRRGICYPSLKWTAFGDDRIKIAVKMSATRDLLAFCGAAAEEPTAQRCDTTDLWRVARRE